MEMKLDEILSKETWKTYGAVSTPREVVDLMLRLSGIKKWEGLEILEPGFGLGDFSAAIYREHPHNSFTGVEINPQIYAIARSSYPQFNLILADFLLWESEKKYDLAIGNPPYGIVGDESHYPIHALNGKKPSYKRVSTTWYGKYNIYGAFIEKGLRLLKEGGRLIYIVPATFMILDDFKLLRKFLGACGRVSVYYLGGKVFKGKTVSTAIIIITRGLEGIELYEVQGLRDIIKYWDKDSYKGEIIRFDTPETEAFERGKVPLGKIFTIHFAARSPEVRKHPLVSEEPGEGLVAILTGRNLHQGWIDYEHSYSGYWLPREAAPSLRQYYGVPHLIVGHTKGGKVVAAVDTEGYPWREEMHLLPKLAGVDIVKIAQYLNSEEVQKYMSTLYKDITSHVTVTQLKLLPIPLKLLKRGSLPQSRLL